MACSDLWSISRLRKHLSNYGIHLEKGKGQHFLLDRDALAEIVNCLETNGPVLEVGAGVGSLTCLLIGRFSPIWAIEIDEAFRRPFNDNCGSEKSTHFVNKDFLEVDESEFLISPSNSASIVGNIPYHLSVPILEKVIDNRNLYSQGAFTLQKEVADKLLSSPGSRDVTPLTFLVRSYAEVELVQEIPASSFFPTPEVDSCTVRLDFLSEPVFHSSKEVFFSVVRAAFNHRRKTIRNALRANTQFSYSSEEIDRILDLAKIESRLRPEQLDIEDYDRLARVVVDLSNTS